MVALCMLLRLHRYETPNQTSFPGSTPTAIYRQPCCATRTTSQTLALLLTMAIAPNKPIRSDPPLLFLCCFAEGRGCRHSAQAACTCWRRTFHPRAPQEHQQHQRQQQDQQLGAAQAHRQEDQPQEQGWQHGPNHRHRWQQQQQQQLGRGHLTSAAAVQAPWVPGWDQEQGQGRWAVLCVQVLLQGTEWGRRKVPLLLRRTGWR